MDIVVRRFSIMQKDDRSLLLKVSDVTHNGYCCLLSSVNAKISPLQWKYFIHSMFIFIFTTTKIPLFQLTTTNQNYNYKIIIHGQEVLKILLKSKHSKVSTTAV